MAQCTAKVYVADDYGDNYATCTCDLEEGHEGQHEEVSMRYKGGSLVIRWDDDESDRHES